MTYSINLWDCQTRLATSSSTLVTSVKLGSPVSITLTETPPSTEAIATGLCGESTLEVLMTSGTELPSAIMDWNSETNTLSCETDDDGWVTTYPVTFTSTLLSYTYLVQTVDVSV